MNLHLKIKKKLFLKSTLSRLQTSYLIIKKELIPIKPNNIIKINLFLNLNYSVMFYYFEYILFNINVCICNDLI